MSIGLLVSVFFFGVSVGVIGYALLVRSTLESEVKGWGE